MTGWVESSDAEEGGTHMVWGARHGKPQAQERHPAMGLRRVGPAA